MLANGKDIPKGMILRHTCDRRNCVNYQHLLVGTHGDNVRDKVERNRQQRGETSPLASLDELDVLALRYLNACQVQSQRGLAKMFGITNTNVSLIVLGKRWSHI